MEWLVLLAVAALAALFIALPRRSDADRFAVEVDDLRAERASVLAELREVEEDTLAGRITAEDRSEARRALGIRLRHITEQLRDLGETPDGRPSASTERS